MKEEFGRILGRPSPVTYMANTFKDVWVQKILKHGLTQTVGNSILASVNEACEDEPNRKSGKYMVYYFCIICQSFIVPIPYFFIKPSSYVSIVSK